MSDSLTERDMFYQIVLMLKQCQPKLPSNSMVNSRNDNGDTPLMLSVKCAQNSQNSQDRQKRLRIVELLCNAGSDVNIADNNGLKPLDIAIQQIKHLDANDAVLLIS